MLNLLSYFEIKKILQFLDLKDILVLFSINKTIYN